MGSNLEDPLAQIKTATHQLSQIPSCTLTACSPLYQSKAIGPGEQPDYINGVAQLETTLNPIELLEQLQAIENHHGRQRLIRWGARTLDLDLLLYDRITLDSDRLQLPHPRMLERNFVIYPLYDIAPELILPNNKPLSGYRQQCPEDGIKRATHAH